MYLDDAQLLIARTIDRAVRSLTKELEREYDLLVKWRSDVCFDSLISHTPQPSHQRCLQNCGA